MQEDWKYVLWISGGLFAMMDGHMIMLKLPVDNWDTPLMVRPAWHINYMQVKLVQEFSPSKH